MQLITLWPVVGPKNKTFTAFRWNVYRQVPSTILFEVIEKLWTIVSEWSEDLS